MNDEMKKSVGKASPLVKALYVISAVLMAIFVYMVIVNAMYISNYAASYGVSVSDMMFDAIQYVITGSISYFVYGALIFCAGRIIRMLQSGATPSVTAASDSVTEGAAEDSEETVEGGETAGIVETGEEAEAGDGKVGEN